MRYLMRVCGVILLSSLLTCCVSMGDRTVKMSTAQLQQKLNHKLAKPLIIMKVIRIQLSNTLISMDPANGKIHALMDARMQSELLGKEVTGKLGVSGALRFDQAHQLVVLDQPEVETLQLEGANNEWNDVVKQLTKYLSGKWLSQLVLYEVKPEDLSYAGHHYLPTDLQVTADGLQVTLKPQ